jgi:hypothetical protein
MSRIVASLIMLVLFLSKGVLGEGPKTSEVPEAVTICALRADPPAYNHKRIKVTGLLSHGFEDFTLFDPRCTDGIGIWLEYGGVTSSETVYCCGVSAERDRPKSLVVDGLEIPLIRNSRFRALDRLLQKPPDRIVHATIVGHFFVGEKQQLPGGVFWGYGHFGCCPLLTIEEVVDVDRQDRRDLDYRATTGEIGNGDKVCNSRRLLSFEIDAGNLDSQQRADRGGREWSFTDPQRVASEALQQALAESGATPPVTLRQVGEEPGRLIYGGVSQKSGQQYYVVVSRPYWLTFYAKNPRRIAWVAIGAYETENCPPEKH